MRRDDQGRWSYRLEGDLSKIAGVDGRYYAVTDAAFSTWIDEPGPSEIAEPELAIQGYQDSCPRGDSLGLDPRFTVPLRALAAA